jgi:putative ABC transport system permease protein
MYILPKPGASAYAVEAEILSILREHHKVHPKDNGVIGSYNSQKDFDQVASLFGGITAFSWLVAIGTIIAGAVGVGNIMLISVKERTKEIGIRKALGATPLNVVSSIIQESFLITFFAGCLGLVAGVHSIVLLGKVASNAKGGFGTFINPEVSFSTAFSAIAVLLVAGTLAALLPARKAALVDPVIALQSE